VAADVSERVGKGRRVIHLGVHTFTPELDGVVRGADVALLYDPARPWERALCAVWARSLAARLPHLAVRRNQPYRGASDGLTTWLRTRFAPRVYLGIEVEVNQRLLGPSGRFPPGVGSALADGLLAGLGAFVG
jgi:predicted N-formylglutamate amidohydrolase